MHLPQTQSPRKIRQRGNKRRLNQVIVEHALSLWDTNASLQCWETGRGDPQMSLDSVKNKLGWPPHQDMDS